MGRVLEEGRTCGSAGSVVGHIVGPLGPIPVTSSAGARPDGSGGVKLVSGSGVSGAGT